MDTATDRTYEERIAWNALKGIDPPIDFTYMRAIDKTKSIQNYIEFGLPPGSCFEAAIIGDLHGCYTRMHPYLKSEFTALQIFASWFDDHAPEQCYGSKNKYNEWVLGGGLFGIEKDGKRIHLKCDYRLTEL